MSLSEACQLPDWPEERLIDLAYEGYPSGLRIDWANYGYTLKIVCKKSKATWLGARLEQLCLSGIKVLLDTPETGSRKRKRPPGRPRDFDHDAIRGIAETYLKDVGIPSTLAMLCEKVRDACPDFTVTMVRLPCPHCGRAVRPSDFTRDGEKITLVCGGCHKDIWAIELCDGKTTAQWRSL